MARVKIKIGDKVQERNIPDSVDEMPFAKFIRLNDAYTSGNSKNVVAAWLSVTPEEVDAMPAKAYNDITEAVSWYGNEAVELILTAPLLNEIAVEGKMYELPTIGFEDKVTLSQLLAFDDIAKKEGTLIAAAAIMVGPAILTNGKWDENCTNSYVLQAKLLPAPIAYPIALFFIEKKRRSTPQSIRSNGLNTSLLRLRGWTIWSVLALLALLIIWLVTM
jgi:hypothetical protein